MTTATRTAQQLRRFHELGMTHARHGRLVEALEAFRAATRIAPRQGGLHYLAGTALARLGRWNDAIPEYRAELAINPRHAGALSALGSLAARIGRTDEAVAVLRDAIEINPDDRVALRTLGACLLEQQRPDEAIHVLDRAVQADPTNAAVWSSRGLADVQLGRVGAALECFRRALELDPRNTETRQQWLYTLQHRVGITRQELLAEHRKWTDGIARGPVRQRLDFPNHPDPVRRPRLGIVSKELSRSAAATLTLRGFEALAAAGYAIVCFCLSDRNDVVTVRFRQMAVAWHDLPDADDATILASIGHERIDILFDLAGPTRYGCLPLFARRAAPVQVSWAGYVGTTGLDTMDALIADLVQVPPGEDVDYVEQVVRLPDTYICFDPDGAAPPVTPLPALSNGYVTFGCFNRAAKLNAPLARLWAEIVRDQPRSRLVLARGQFGTGPVRDELHRLLVDNGVPPEQVDFVGTSSHTALLQAHGRVDIMLDPQPYSGGVMTLEALWMGVPVVTQSGETFAGRHSASHLHAAGLDEWIASDCTGYVATAIQQSRDLVRLAALRAGLRDRITASPLCDGTRFAAHLGPELDRLWRQWCAPALAMRGQGPAPAFS